MNPPERFPPDDPREMSKSLFILLPVMALALAGCGGKDPAASGKAETVRVGFLAAGDRVTYVDAAGIAVTEANERGGVLGRQVELVSRIEIEEASVSVETAGRMIVEDGVVAIAGPNRSSHAIEVGEVAQRHGLPMVTTSATNPDVTKAGDFVFMAAFTDLFQGEVMARFAKEDLGLAKVAVLTRRGEVYTEGISGFFRSVFTASGGEIVADEFYDSGETDFAGQLERIAAAEPEAVFISGFSGEVALVTQQARALPLQTAEGEPSLFLGADAWDNPNLLGDETAELEGSYFTTHFSPDTDEPGARRFIDTYRSLYGAAPSGGDAVSYDAVRLLLEAIERAGSLEPEAVRDQLAATENYAGATRIAGYDENRHPEKSVVIMTVRDGASQFHQQIDPG